MSKVPKKNPKLVLHWGKIQAQWESPPISWFIETYAGGFYSTKQISTSEISVIMSMDRLVLVSNSGEQITFKIMSSEARIFKDTLEYHIYTKVTKKDVANPNWVHVLQDNGFGSGQ